MKKFSTLVALALFAFAAFPSSADAAEQVRYKTAKVDGVGVFYREAGSKDAPNVLLLPGYPTDSHMFRDLIPQLAEKYHVIAPDYPGFGYSDMPDRKKFAYTFDNYAKVIGSLTKQLKLDKFAVYVMDYGAPVGFRLAAQNPEKISAIIVQNGNAYDEGLSTFWDPIKTYWKTGASKDREAIRWLTSLKATEWQYSNGVKDMSLVSPDAKLHDQALLDRAGNQEIQLDIFYDYRTNPPLYASWQEYFRKHQPPILVVWGKNDGIFASAGGEAFKRDLPDAEIHMLDTGHFALEEYNQEIATKMIDFLDRKVK